MLLDGDGMLALSVAAGGLCIDPATPASAVLHSDPAMDGGYHSLGLATDGRYLVSNDVSLPTEVEPLVAIDPVSGFHDILVPDLNQGPGAEDLAYTGLTVSDNQRMYLTPFFGSITRVDLTEPTPVPVALPGSSAAYSGVVFVGGSGLVPVPDIPVLPNRMHLANAVPNPFNPRTVIRFELPRAGHAELAIFDLKGRRVTTLVDGQMTAGNHEVTWQGRDRDGRGIPSGVYLSRLVVGDEVRTRKLVLAQ